MLDEEDEHRARNLRQYIISSVCFYREYGVIFTHMLSLRFSSRVQDQKFVVIKPFCVDLDVCFGSSSKIQP